MGVTISYKIQQMKNITVKIKPELKKGDFLTWKNHEELDVCYYFNINDATKISIETTSETSFCPSMIKIQMADSKHTSYTYKRDIR